MNGAFLATLVVTFVFFLLVMALLGLGSMSGRRPLTGSCGGIDGRGCSCRPDQRRCEAWRQP